jgi:hypothetical protein
MITPEIINKAKQNIDKRNAKKYFKNELFKNFFIGFLIGLFLGLLLCGIIITLIL